MNLTYLLKVRLEWDLRATMLSVVRLQDRYDESFQARINACPVITVSDLGHLKADMSCAQVRYGNAKEFVAIADTLEIMNDFKVRRIR